YTSNATPVDVTSIDDAIAVATGGSHSCALLSDGGVQCWGRGWEGQLGNGSTGGSSTIPVDVSSLDNAIAITGGHSHTCALRPTGAIACSGYNGNGQLGDGGNETQFAPVPVSGIDDAIAIAGGVGHTCAVRSSGAIACW